MRKGRQKAEKKQVMGAKPESKLKKLLALLMVMTLVVAPQMRGQEASVLNGLVEGMTGGITDQLTGYALTAIGLNSQSSTDTSVLSQLTQINNELDTISTELSSIQNAIQTQTCVDALSSTAVTNALTSIGTVSTTYTNLLQAGENPNGSVSQADINNFLDQVANGPGGGLPSMSAALTAINIALQSTNNDGIIGSCQRAVTPVPTTGSFGGDAAFYSDPLNLLQYFADYQTMGALLEVEYYNYEAFLSSPYYSATTISNGLPANQAALVCENPTGQTATECGFARDTLEQVFGFMENQYSANGVPYSTYDSSGKLQTGLYFAGSNSYYLFAASLEEFTNSEDIPQNNCGTPLTSSSPCGLTASDNPARTSTYPGGLYSPFYQYESGWAGAQPQWWLSVLNNFSSLSSKSSETLATYLSDLGFQNPSGKIILTSGTYTADVDVPTDVHNVNPFDQEAACFLDTGLQRSFSTQPFCNNGATVNGSAYGNEGNLLELWDTWNNGGCMTFRANGTLLSESAEENFYGVDFTYNSPLSTLNGYNEGTCPSGYWVDNSQPGWLITNGITPNNQAYLWPAIDFSSPTCGTNYSYGLTQPAVARSGTNFLGVPTMCGTDFDLFFATKSPRNPYWQVAITSGKNPSGTASSSATIGPVLFELQDTSSGTAKAMTLPYDITVDLSSTSLTGTFYAAAAADGGEAITSIVIPHGNTGGEYWYGDTTAGTPQLMVSSAYMVPAVQTVTMTGATTTTPEVEIVEGSADNVGTGKPNGTVTVHGQLSVPSGIKLHEAQNPTFEDFDRGCRPNSPAEPMAAR